MKFIMENISFYCVNFFNEERKKKMQDRFQNLNKELYFVAPVFTDDSRIPKEILSDKEKRTWAIMFQHLDSIRHFYETTEKEYLIVCEDDIMISKYFNEDLPKIIEDFNVFKIDILLLGYLLDISFEPEKHHPKIKQNKDVFSDHDFTLLEHPKKYRFYHFPYHVWGSQMYLIHRKHAKFLIDKYTTTYGIEDRKKCHFNPDWTITKDKNHAILYPMLAVEEGLTDTNDISQNDFHKKCMETNYDPAIFF